MLDQDQKASLPESPRKVGMFHAGSTTVAIITLAKNTLGAGILGLPLKTMYAGIPLFMLLLVLAAFFTVKSIEYICLGARRTGKYVFEEITESLYGRGMGIFLGIAMLVNCYGASIVYVVTIIDSFSTLLASVQEVGGPNWPVYATLIVGGTILVPFSVFERISSLRPLSLAGVIGAFITVLSIVYAFCRLGVSETFSKDGGSVTGIVMRPLGTFMEMMTVLNILCFAFCNQFNVPQVFGEMSEKSHKSAMSLGIVSTGIAFGLYILSSVCGYLAYGTDIQGDIINNFKSFTDNGDVLIYMGVSAVTLSVSICHLLNNFPMRLSVLYFLPPEYENNKLIKISVPIFTAVSTIGFAIWYQDMGFFLGIVGALTGSIIGYIVPALFAIRIAQRDRFEAHSAASGDVVAGKEYSQLPWYNEVVANPVAYTMIAVGTVIGIVGTFSEIYGAVNKE
jgi:solute carrier family 38 (sodium-coupled neutral amino acid transporter), member 7/8